MRTILFLACAIIIAGIVMVPDSVQSEIRKGYQDFRDCRDRAFLEKMQAEGRIRILK